MTTMYGIPNCDTVRRARAALAERGVAYRFHDFRRDGVTRDMLDRWVDALGWEPLLNRNGTTFRRLPEGERAVHDADRAVALMLDHPAAIRRPVLEVGDTIRIGHRPGDYDDLAQGGAGERPS